MVAHISSTALKQLYRYWSDKRVDRTLPSRGDIDPGELKGLLPNVTLIDVELSPRRYLVRLAGTQVVAGYGEEQTGRYLHELDFGDIGDQTLAMMDDIVEFHRPSYASGEFQKRNGKCIRFERLAMPLSSDGAVVDKILGGVVFVPLRALESSLSSRPLRRRVRYRMRRPMCRTKFMEAVRA